MKNTMVLSKREKILLYILLCLLIFVIGWYFFVNPIMKSNLVLKTEYLTLESQYNVNKETMSTYGDLDVANQQVNNDLDANRANFHELVTTEQVDKIFTTLVQKHGLIPVSLSLQEATSQNLIAYTKEETKTPKDSQSIEDKNAIVEVMAVKQVVAVTKLSTNLADYIEVIKQMPGVHITSLSYTSGKENTNITMEYEIYMLNK